MKKITYNIWLAAIRGKIRNLTKNTHKPAHTR